MPSILLEYRLRIRNFDDTADVLVVSSVRGDALPFLAGPPRGDGSSLDPFTGVVQAGTYTGRIVDAITGGTSRVLTSILEDSGGRPQLGQRKGYWDFRENGGGWLTLGAGLLTRLSPASDSEWDVTISEAMMLEHQATSFAPRTGLVRATANAAIGATAIAVAALPFLITSGTTLLFAGLKGATLTADAIAGATALAVSALGVAIANGDVAVATEPIAPFLARWPLRGCIAGGPVRGGFLKQPDLGGWEMRANNSDALSGIRALSFFSGYGAPSPSQLILPAAGARPVMTPSTIEWTNDVTKVMPAVNEAADNFYVGLTGSLLADEYRTIEETRRALGWRGLVIELVGVGFFQPQQLARFNGVDVGKDGSYRQIGRYAGGSSASIGGFFIRAPGIPVSNAITYRVRLFSIEVSEQSPIYFTGHPVDYMAALWAEQGFSWDPSPTGPLEKVRDAIGRQRRFSTRKTSTVETGTELEAACYGPFGVGVRVDSLGRLEPFVSRIFASPAPSVVLSDADVVQGTTKLGDLDATDPVRRVIVTQQFLVTAQDATASGFDASKALDGFLTQSHEQRQENADPFAVGQTEQTYDVPGMIHLVDQAPDDLAFSMALAKETFDRRGRGKSTGVTTAIRGGAGDALAIGDELLIAVKQLPNKNKRYADDNTVGARRMQVTRVTPQTIGKELELEDSGPNASAVLTLPTLSIARSTDLPRNVVELTITNAAGLNAAGIGVRVRIATVAVGAPAIPDYADFIAYLPGQIPTGAIRLPQTTAGLIVFAIARSEEQGFQPSAYSAAVNVTLDPMNAPTAVGVTPSGTDGSRATVAWTIGSGMTDCAIDVFLRPQGDPVSSAIRRAILEPESTQYVLEQLTPTNNYTASVQHRDKITGDVSALVDVNFTAGSTTGTLPVPLYPQAFVGSQSGLSLLNGLYGLSVWGAAFPSFIEFWEALETAPLSGVYGAFVQSARVPTVQNDWTTYANTAPNDGLRRQIEARHVRDGANNSSFTAPVTVAPWSSAQRRPLSPPTRLIPYADDAQYAATADLSGQVYLLGAGVAVTQKVSVGTPSTPATMQRIYRIPFSAFVLENTTVGGLDKVGGYVTPSAIGASVNAVAPVVLPQGSTIVSFVVRCYAQTSASQVTGKLKRANDGAVPLDLSTAILAAYGAWTLVSGSSVSEAVNSSYLYYVWINMLANAITADARVSYVEITVTVPDLNTGL